MDLNYRMVVLHPMVHTPNEYVSEIKKGNAELEARRKEIIDLKAKNGELEEQLYPTIS